MNSMKKVLRKFGDHFPCLEATAVGELDLRNANYKLYSKLYRFYTKQGVSFTGDADIDYNLVVNYLYEDLFADY